VAEPFYFICYSSQDGEEFALQLADQLAAGPPSISVWIDQRKLQAGVDRYTQVGKALTDCHGVLYLMTTDSVNSNCPCTQEWIRALKYKKPVLPLIFHPDAELPFRLEPREPIVFAESFDAGLARLREHLRWRATDEGKVHTMSERLNDARRDLAGARSSHEKTRISEEIAQLQQEIAALQETINHPQEAKERTKKNIEIGLERERQPEVPVATKAETRFINRAPLIPPTYFQNRHVETKFIGDFIGNDNMRLMTVVGRGGVGKTAMVCRLLQSLQGGKLPDDGGELTIDGIVYLSGRSGHPVNFPNLFYDLCKLVPEEKAKYLDQIYKDSNQRVETQMQALLAEIPPGRIIVLLDNFEDVLNTETQAIKETELNQALRAVLEAPPHGLKFIITTRVAPQALLRVQPGLQDVMELDQGLKSPFAENVLKFMDTSGTLGLNAPDAPLAEAREATRGFPRALEAVVGILRTDRSTDLRGLLKELRQLGSRAEDVVRDLVGEAFNRLDPLAQEIMQALAIYGKPVPPVAVDYLLQPYRIGIDSSKTLSRLVSMQFVRGEAGRFYMHQVDRDYALSRLLEGEPDDRDKDPLPLTRYALRHRAAQYFKETRKPRESWKTLEDLAPQLAEFEMRVAGKDYDAAASVLIDIDYDYLDVWGHYRLLVDQYEQLQGKLNDPDLEWNSVTNLAASYERIGQFDKALPCREKALALAREHGNKQNEAGALLGLGAFYKDMADDAKSLDNYQQALAMYKDLGDSLNEALVLGALANRLSDLGRLEEAIEQYQKAIALHKMYGNQKSVCHDTYNMADSYKALGENTRTSELAEEARRLAQTLSYRLIESAATSLQADLMVREQRFEDAIKTYDEAIRLADEANAVQMQMVARRNLAWAHLLAGNLDRARAVAEDAAKYRYPVEYASTLSVNAVIALRQKDTTTACGAFEQTLSQAETQLANKASGFSSAYDKALALAGLALCRNAGLSTAAANAYRDARALSVAPGVIMEELQRLDQLVAADTAGTLTSVRAAAAGEP